MNTAKLEFTVGLFMLIGVICLAYVSVKLGKMELMGSNYYRVVAQFDSASGLKNGARVEIAGVEVGSVANIALNNATGDLADVTMKIRDGVKIDEYVIASVRTSGIIGDKFIKLKPGGGDEYLKEGSKIRETESAIDIEELVSKFIHGNID